MKEKTFEEMIKELQNKAARNFFMKEEVADLMQQVREATIAECTDILLNRDYSWSGQIELEYKKLPTDRILTDK